MSVQQIRPWTVSLQQYSGGVDVITGSEFLLLLLLLASPHSSVSRCGVFVQYLRQSVSSQLDGIVVTLKHATYKLQHIVYSLYPQYAMKKHRNFTLSRVNLRQCSVKHWSSGRSGIELWSRRPTGFLQCFNTVCWAIWLNNNNIKSYHDAAFITVYVYWNSSLVGVLCGGMANEPLTLLSWVSKGGMVTLIKDSIHYTEITCQDSAECILVKLRTDSSYITVANLCITPGHNLDTNIGLISPIFAQRTIGLIVGDLNAKNTLWGSQAPIQTKETINWNFNR